LASIAGRSEEPPRPPHIIRPDEVASWLAESVNKVVTYHRTDATAATDIIAHGVDVTKTHIGSFGQGFYTATHSDPFYGEVEIPVAVRLLRPRVGHMDDLELELDELVEQFRRDRRLTPDVAIQIRQRFLAEGYDGIIARDAGGNGVDYVIALEGSAVKVVRP
jgi:hypothetical protein